MCHVRFQGYSKCLVSFGMTLLRYTRPLSNGSFREVRGSRGCALDPLIRLCLGFLGKPFLKVLKVVYAPHLAFLFKGSL